MSSSHIQGCTGRQWPTTQTCAQYTDDNDVVNIEIKVFSALVIKRPNKCMYEDSLITLDHTEAFPYLPLSDGQPAPAMRYAAK